LLYILFSEIPTPFGSNDCNIFKLKLHKGAFWSFAPVATTHMGRRVKKRNIQIIVVALIDLVCVPRCPHTYTHSCMLSLVMYHRIILYVISSSVYLIIIKILVIYVHRTSNFLFDNLKIILVQYHRNTYRYVSTV
jgi:hypothetical protein